MVKVGRVTRLGGSWGPLGSFAAFPREFAPPQNPDGVQDLQSEYWLILLCSMSPLIGTGED